MHSDDEISALADEPLNLVLFVDVLAEWIHNSDGLAGERFAARHHEEKILAASHGAFD